jgi:pilus assembly protein Flp/PilA
MTEFLKSLYVRLSTSISAVKNQKGQGLVEYALILVLIAIVVIAMVTGIGGKANEVFSTVNSALN